MVKENQSVIRVSRILKALAAARGALTVAEISEAVDLPQSTVYRLLSTLEKEELVERNEGRTRYKLGLELFRLGSAALNDLGLEREAYPFMQRMAAACDETINLGLLRGRNVLYIQKIESKEPLRADLVVGNMVPAHCTALGKALLAYLPDSQLDILFDSYTLPKMGPNCILNTPQLKQELRCIRQRGYSIDDEELSAHIRAIGAPIRDHHSQIIAGIAIAGPASRLSLERLEQLAPLVTGSAREISRRLGYIPLREEEGTG